MSSAAPLSFSAVLEEIKAGLHDRTLHGLTKFRIAVAILKSRFHTDPIGWLSPYLLAKQGLLLADEADEMTLLNEARIRTLGKLPRIPQAASRG